MSESEKCKEQLIVSEKCSELNPELKNETIVATEKCSELNSETMEVIKIESDKCSEINSEDKNEAKVASEKCSELNSNVKEETKEVSEKCSEVKEESKETSGKDEPQTDHNDPYAYLHRDEFTSEKFKIEIRDLPRYYGISEMKKLLNEKLKLNSSKIKALKRGSSWAYVSFRNEEDKTRAVETLNGFKWKGKKLRACVAKPMPDPLVKKRKENSDDLTSNKMIKLDIPQEERLKNNTIPYWNIPYEEQLTKKNEDIKHVLIRMGTQLSHVNPDLLKLLEENKVKYDGLPCELWDMRQAEQIEGYRNKCEFTVGIDQETDLPTVGFRLGSYVNGFTGVAPVDSLVHIPERMKLAVKIFEKFVRKSDLEVFNPEIQTGHFKQLMARYATTSNELMLVVGINPQKLTNEKLDALKKDIVSFFTKEEGIEANVTSLYYQAIVKRTSGVDPPTAEHLWGDTHIHESLLDMTFSISPEAFFQVNSQGAEILYQSAIELATPTLQSTVVDICCGTGTIGLCFSKKCNQVLGLELVPKAIEDAKQNAKVNDVDNCEFFAGRAEEILSSVMYRATQDDVIAIVDPPRAGLHQKAIQQLRKTKKLNKLVYISCDPSAALKNFVDLGRAESKTLHGNPLVPIRAVPVDLFPYTKHCELLIYFERINKLE